MGKLEREAKHVTARIMEVGGRFGFWKTGRQGGQYSEWSGM